MRTPLFVPACALLWALLSPAAAARAEAPKAPDPAPWHAVLAAHATPEGFRYGALAKDAAARAQLSTYLDAVAKMPRGAPLSAWLNAYNATVVAAVLARHPLSSVMKVDGFFKQRTHRIAGKLRSLDEVEHEIIRKRFPDARVHVALNCGAKSCPPLHPKAFREATLDATLDALARAMVRDRAHVRRGADGGLQVSEIFLWFEQDFVRDYGSVAGFVRKYGGRTWADLKKGVKVSKIAYDWRLNAAK